MAQIVSKPDHGIPIGYLDDDPTKPVFPTPAMRLYMDDLTGQLNSFLLGETLRIRSYTVAGLPDVPHVKHPGLIYVSDEVGGPVPAFSDGTDWRRVTDRVIVA